jgi:hypothetical protein
MRKLLIVTICCALFTGCATTKPEPAAPAKQRRPTQERQRKTVTKPETGSFSYRMSASRRLGKAVDLLEEGDVAGATKLLNAICSGHSAPGVTDEALFRLALLTLKPAPDRPVSKQGHHLLRRLKEEYPSSPWTAQAAPLMELITVDEELRHQNRSLKTANQSLSKKITELNDTIDQLKNLDLELEQKNR